MLSQRFHGMLLLSCLQLLLVELASTATIVHSGLLGNSAVSHQSFTRILNHTPDTKLVVATPAAPATPALPAVAALPAFPQPIAIIDRRQIYEPAPGRFQGAATQLSHTPAHLTFAASPVVHQMLPKLKPVRNISYASLLVAPRALLKPVHS